MGVTGLWRLVEPAGRPVHLDSLRGRILAVDISIWLHQVVKGFQDAKGAAIANSHLLGLFQRLCKLLYYGIRPIFVFDGCFPLLKKQTIINRQKKKSQARNNADKLQRELMEAIAKHIAVKNSLTPSTSHTNTSPIKKTINNDDDLFKLPPMASTSTQSTSSSDSEEEIKDSTKSKYHVDLHTFDVNSDYFKNLNAREKHDLLTELKETRKASSWGRINELPAESNDFSDYQMKRLLKRRQVQVSLEEAEKEIGGQCLSINELEILLNEEGIDTKINSIPTRQIASNENVHFLLVKDVKKAINQAVKKEAEKHFEEKRSVKQNIETDISNDCVISEGELGKEFDNDLDAAIKLSLECDESNDSKNLATSSKIMVIPDCDEDDLQTAIKLSLKCNKDNEQSKIDTLSSSEDEACVVIPNDKTDINMKRNNLNPAKSYMLEFSGLSEFEVNRILDSELNKKKLKDHKHSTKDNMKKEFVDSVNIVAHKNVISENLVNFEKHDTDNIITSIMRETNDVFQKISEIPNKSNDDLDLDDVECVSTSTNESFEEVSETNLSKVQKDDIFADIFTDESKFDILHKNILSQIKNKLTSTDKIDEENSSKSEEDSTVVISHEIVEVDKDIPKETVEVDKDIPKEIKVDKDIPKEILDENNIIADDIIPSQTQHKKIKTLNDLKNVVYNTSNSLENYEGSTITDQQITREAVITIEKDLEHQVNVLEKEQNKLDRMGRNITDEMTKDAQELLRLFGIPYIVAPTEAEAQCAFLESANLTDGTITDDSDIWLFGGNTVYRNFFDQQKHVLRFVSDNISQLFKLQREDLILLALLVGSDYTLGINGVGPVTALEILAAFPRSKDEIKPPYTSLSKGLLKFREWWFSKQNFTHSSLRSKLKNISLSEEFPNVKIIEAYLCPEVETSKDAFTWGTPDVAALRDFARDKFGWSREKTDNILNPVLKRLDIKITQQSITRFFNSESKVDTKVEKMSKRVQKAIENLNSEKVEEPSSSLTVDQDIPNKKRKTIQNKRKGKKSDDSIEKKVCSSTNEVAEEIDKNSIPKNTNEAKDAINESNRKLKSVHSKINIRKRKTENIPQRENDQNILLQNKLKAIELFRKSKTGPGFVRKKKKVFVEPKADAGLSESSESD